MIQTRIHVPALIHYIVLFNTRGLDVMSTRRFYLQCCYAIYMQFSRK